MNKALLLSFCLMACTPMLGVEFPASTLSQLNQLEKKPELYLKGDNGAFLVTNNTRVEMSLRDGRNIACLAAEVFVNETEVIFRGREQKISLAQIKTLRFIDRY